MKKTLIILVMLLLCFSCSEDSTTKVFKKTADERRLANENEFHKHLKSSNWVIELFSKFHEDYGGVSIHTAYKNDYKVTINSEFEKSFLREPTSYTLTSNSGTIISFNEYNKGIHQFSTPSAITPKGILGTIDYEFVYLKRKGGILYTKGVKTRNTIRFVKTSKSAKEYYKDFKIVKDYIYKPKNIFNKFMVANKKVNFVRSRRLFKYNEDISNLDVDKYTKTSFTLTDKGLRFFKPFTINGIEVFELFLDKKKNQLSSKDGQVILQMYTTAIDFNQEYWNIKLEDGFSCKKALDLYPSVNEAAKKHDKVGFTGINLTKTINIGLNKIQGGSGIRFYTKIVDEGRSSGFDGEYKAIFKPYTDDEGLFSLDIKRNKPFYRWQFSSYCDTYVNFIINNAPYTIETLGSTIDNNGKEFLKILLTSKKDANVWFILNNKTRPN